MSKFIQYQLGALAVVYVLYMFWLQVGAHDFYINVSTDAFWLYWCGSLLEHHHSIYAGQSVDYLWGAFVGHHIIGMWSMMVAIFAIAFGRLQLTRLMLAICFMTSLTAICAPWPVVLWMLGASLSAKRPASSQTTPLLLA